MLLRFTNYKWINYRHISVEVSKTLDNVVSWKLELFKNWIQAILIFKRKYIVNITSFDQNIKITPREDQKECFSFRTLIPLNPYNGVQTRAGDAPQFFCWKLSLFPSSVYFQREENICTSDLNELLSSFFSDQRRWRKLNNEPSWKM